MNIAYIEPLTRAWARMVSALFKPFEIKKWFILGFSTFLADLTEYHGGGKGSDSNGDFDIDEFFTLPEIVGEWIRYNSGWFTLIIVGIILLIIIIVLLIWLSSRGKFMFLDNVLTDRAEIAKPWHEYRTLGNSLFLWRLTYCFIAISIFISYFLYCYDNLWEMYHDYASDYEMIMTAIGMGLFAILMMIVSGYISIFLTDFVVPIMYKNKIKTMEAWSHFLALFREHMVRFILFGLLVFLLAMAVFVMIIAAGFLTCCIGFVLLIIPYIGSVILLPVSYTFRAFSLEFFAQFGSEYNLFPTDVRLETDNS